MQSMHAAACFSRTDIHCWRHHCTLHVHCSRAPSITILMLYKAMLLSHNAEFLVHQPPAVLLHCRPFCRWASLPRHSTFQQTAAGDG